MIPEILNSFGLTLDYLHRLVADVEENQLTVQPHGVINHPAWVMGHLAHSFQAIGGERGLPPWLPEDWSERFGTGSTPIPDRTAYPTKQTLLAAIDDGRQRLTAALSILTDRDLAVPLPDERYRSVFPTLGHAVLHILGAHAAVHVGQVTVWRRAMGLPTTTVPFN